MKSKMWVYLFAALLAPSLACAQIGPIFDTASRVPSNLLSPLGPQSPDPVKKLTYIACYDASTGNLQNCGFDMTITGLHQPDTDPENNGGHTHPPAHPVGEIQVTSPTTSGKSTFQSGQTIFDVFVITYEVEDVSGKVDTFLNLRVPPGWHTVSPQPCDATFTSWCFSTTIDVAVPGLVSLPDGSPFYVKARRGAPDHRDEFAFFGTDEAISKLTDIAEYYNDLTNLQLSVNDMSLFKGGLFDVDSDFLAPHSWHRIGQSADINKPAGRDCRSAYDLKLAVALAFASEGTTFFSRRRSAPSAGRFLCETGNNNNIHIDFDVTSSPTK